MAFRLWHAALCLGDEWRMFLDDPDVVIEDLPRLARRYGCDRAWLERFVASFDRLAERLAGQDGDDVLARCTADELALHLVIDLAEALATDNAVDPADPADLAALPDHGDEDIDFGLTRDVLFEDHDVLWLFNSSLDGIERQAILRSAHLHPREWFEPFRPSTEA